MMYFANDLEVQGQAPKETDEPATTASSCGAPPGATSQSTDGQDEDDADGVVAEAKNGNEPVAGPLLGSVDAQAGTAMQPLIDDMSGTMDLLYYGPIKIGTPAQVSF